jgi:hypothetical protein
MISGGHEGIAMNALDRGWGLKIELLPALEGQAYNRIVIDGAEQDASAVYFDLALGHTTMLVWHRDGSGPTEARRFLERATRTAPDDGRGAETHGSGER